MNKHTPGPWEIGATYTKQGDEIQVEAFESTGNRSLQVLVRSGNRDADMKLIAAAPDLLEALQQVARMIKWAEKNDDSPKSALSHFITSSPIINAAITKATQPITKE